MARSVIKPNVGDRVVVVEADDLTFKGTVTEVLSSQFMYRVTHVNGAPSPVSPNHNWEKFCFYQDDWSFQSVPIDSQLSR